MLLLESFRQQVAGGGRLPWGEKTLPTYSPQCRGAENAQAELMGIQSAPCPLGMTLSFESLALT